MLKIATVCSGIGAPEKALSLLGIPYEIAFFSEINLPAIRSYCAIHGEDRSKNLGDLSAIDYSKLPADIDLIVGGTPCQDFSTSGLGKGGEEGSGTRSSLMWYYVRMIEQIRPKVVVWENVAAVLSRKHIKNYYKFFLKFTAIGYAVHVGLLNAKFFNLPQNRVRIFLIAIRKDVENNFNFPYGYDSGIRIRDLLLEEVPDKLYSKSLEDMTPYNKQYGQGEHRIMQLGRIKETKFKQGNEVLSIDGIFDCLTTKQGNCILDDRISRLKTLRRLTANESLRFILRFASWRSQSCDCSARGFTDEDYRRCREAGVSEGDLYFQAGNSIAVPTLMAIFGQLFNVPWREKVFKERNKTEQQLLYELPLCAYRREKAA